MHGGPLVAIPKVGRPNSVHDWRTIITAELLQQMHIALLRVIWDGCSSTRVVDSYAYTKGASCATCMHSIILGLKAG